MRRALILAAALLAVGGCERKSSRADCPAGKLCFNAGNQSDPVSLDPPVTSTVMEDNIISDLFVGLVTDDAAGEPIPGAAESWSSSPDGLTWTFKMRRGAVWSDGVPVTAEDEVISMRRLVEPATAAQYAYFGYLFKNGRDINSGKAKPETLGVRALDPSTVQFDLIHPVSYLPQLLKHQAMYVTPAHVVRRWGNAWTQPEHWVSNGPYKLGFWKLGDRVNLVKNPRFYDAANVCLDEVNYYPISDKISAERQVRSGELQMSNTAESSRIAYLRQPDQIPTYIKTHTYLGTGYVTLNSHVPAFSDKRVRLALDMALDREFYADKLMRAGELPAYGFVPPGTAGYPNGARVYFAGWSLERRQAEARRLLAEAGYGPKRPLKFELKAFTGGGQAWVPAIQADWRAIGVQATLAQEEAQVLYSGLNARNYEASVAGWIADYNDPMTYLELLKSSTGQQNYGDYNNPAYDALLDRSDQEPDAAKRAALLAQAEKLMLDEAGVLPYYYWVSRNIVDPKVTGWVDNILDHHRKRWLCYSDADARRRASR